MKLDVMAYEFQKYENWAFELGGDDHGLPENLVKEAKTNELKIMMDMEVFDVVPAADAAKETDGIWVDCRCVITNRGSVSQPIAKARVVAREFADSKRNDLYAGPPGLNFVKIGLAMATERAGERDAPNNIMILDVKTPVVGRLKRPLRHKRRSHDLERPFARLDGRHRVRAVKVDAGCVLQQVKEPAVSRTWMTSCASRRKRIWPGPKASYIISM